MGAEFEEFEGLGMFAPDPGESIFPLRQAMI
jgi:hypothetical protein